MSDNLVLKGNMHIEVLEEREFPHEDDKLSLVLAKNKNGEYVTWEYNIDRDNLYWGHYFSSNQEKEAREDFEMRYQKLLK